MTTQEFMSGETFEGTEYWGEILPGEDFNKNDPRIKPNTTDSILTRGNQKIIEQLQKGDYYNVEYQQGKTLNKLATEYLGDSFAWQIVAEVNEIDPQKPIDINKLSKSGLKIPDQKILQEKAVKYIVNSPQGKQIIKDVKGSILDFAGIGENSQDEFSKGIRECVNKIINFKFDDTKTK
jgi:hypothetical protein